VNAMNEVKFPGPAFILAVVGLIALTVIAGLYVLALTA
jgi:hypothetical protein